MASDKIVERFLTWGLENISDDIITSWFTEFDIGETDPNLTGAAIWQKLKERKITIVSSFDSVMLKPPAIFVALTNEKEETMPMGWHEPNDTGESFASLIAETITIYLVDTTLDGMRIFHLAVFAMLKILMEKLLRGSDYLSSYDYIGSQDILSDTRVSPAKAFMRIQTWNFSGIRRGQALPQEIETLFAPANVVSEFDKGKVKPLEL